MSTRLWSHPLPISGIQAVVLCGGMGTRLRGVVPQVPKALAPVGGRPFLDYLFASVGAVGIRDVVLCTGIGSAAIEKEYGADAHCGMSVVYSREHLQLGTAGALKHAQGKIHSNPFLVLNGDSLLDINFEHLLAAHRTAGALATIALKRMKPAGRYGSAALSPNGEIAGFLEKAEIAGTAASWINAGVYVFDRRILEEIPKAPPAISLEKAILPSLVGRGLFGHACSGFFLDIGVPDDYRRAQTEIPERAQSAASHSR